MVGNPEAMRVAERFTHAIVSLDVDAVAAVYRDDVVVRHNTSSSPESKEENLALVTKIFAIEREHGYHDIRRLPTPEGFVQLHTYKPVLKDGSPAGEARVCMVAKVEGHTIVELYEFLDGSQLAKLWERLGTAPLTS